MGLITFLNMKVIIRLSYLTKNNDASVGHPSVLLKSCIFLSHCKRCYNVLFDIFFIYLNHSYLKKSIVKMFVTLLEGKYSVHTKRFHNVEVLH